MPGAYTTAPAPGNVSGKTRIGVSGNNVETEGFDGVLTRLKLMTARLEDPMPAIQEIAAEFSVMERMRFASGGPAPEFGITESWQPNNYQTSWNKRAQGAIGGGKAPLIASGALREAAINPRITQITAKTADLTISTAGKNGRGYDYGHFHQRGEGVPKREFVTLTPIFWAQSLLIVRQYVLGGRKKSIGQQTDISAIRLKRPKGRTRARFEHPQPQQDFGRWMHAQDPSISAEAHNLRLSEAQSHAPNINGIIAGSQGNPERAINRYLEGHNSVLDANSFRKYLIHGGKYKKIEGARAASGLAGK